MSIISYNLKSIINDLRKNKTVEQISRETGVSKKTIYDIMSGKVVPRKGTIELLEKGLNLEEGGLSVSCSYFDTDYMLEQLNKVFEPEMKEDLPKYDDPSWDGELEYTTLEETLIVECGMDPDSIFKHIMPDDNIQKRVVDYFKSKGFIFRKEELFRPINSISFATAKLQSDSLLNASKINVLSAITLDKAKMMTMFKDINEEYQKVIYNMICDFYVLSHQHDFD